jgi:hypothetical protein
MILGQESRGVKQMPAHEVHTNLETIYIGYDLTQPDVHAKLDMFAKDLQSNHRALLHDFRSVMYYWEAEQNVTKCWSAWAHIILDSISMLEGVGKGKCIGKFMELVVTGQLPAFDPEALPPRIAAYFPDEKFNWSEECLPYVKEVQNA